MAAEAGEYVAGGLFPMSEMSNYSFIERYKGGEWTLIRQARMDGRFFRCHRLWRMIGAKPVWKISLSASRVLALFIVLIAI
jgi:hypothetical protein